MQYIVDAAGMQQIDKATIDTIGIPSMVLMERAALGVTEVVCDLTSKDTRSLVVVGTGNNGGDGLAVARQLRERGYKPTILIIGEREKASDSFLQQLRIVENLHIPVVVETDDQEYDVIVDAIFGVGLTREVTGPYREAIEKINQSSSLIISIDVPSGVDSSSGQIMGCCVKAHHTITFGYLKRGLVLYPGSEMSGNIHIESAGFPDHLVDHISPQYLAYTKADIKELLPKRKAYSNKGTYGRVCIYAGAKNMAGAAYLSGLAAYEAGCGLVKICTVEENRDIIQTLLPEAILETYEENTDFKELIERNNQWAQVVVFGPGMGENTVTAIMLEQLMKSSRIPCIIDADGLNLLSLHLEWLKQAKAAIILTPHIKEMSRLTNKQVTDITKRLVETAESFSQEHNVITILKDARTIVSDGLDHAYINISGNPGMATAGAGDVLTGILGGFLAQGMSPLSAARLGVYIHGLAGDEAKKCLGTYSLKARDIASSIHIILGDNTDEKLHESPCKY